MNRLCFLVLLLAGLAGAGCERMAGAPPGAGGPKVKPDVLFDLPVRREVTDYEEFTGRIDAVKSVDVRARVTGYLVKVDFQEGTEVKEGAALFEIDPRPYQAELARAEASVVQAEAHVNRLNADYHRATSLVSSKAIGREEFDKINGDRAEALAAVGVAKASRDLAKLNLDFTKVTAPFAGKISRRFVDPGNLVKADDTILTSIVALDPMYVYFDVDERTLLQVRRFMREGRIKFDEKSGIHVDLGLADEDGFPHQGTINFEDNKLDASTGTLRMRGVVANPRRILSPGLFVRCRLPIGDPHVVTLVPEQALATDQGRKFVYVVNKGKDKEGNDADLIEYRPVKIGKLHRGLREITDGVKDADRIVVSGLQRIRHGSEVIAKPKEEGPGTKGQEVAEKTAKEKGAAERH